MKEDFRIWNGERFMSRRESFRYCQALVKEMLGKSIPQYKAVELYCDKREDLHDEPLTLVEAKQLVEGKLHFPDWGYINGVSLFGEFIDYNE